MTDVDTTKQSPTCITLCYGIGGLDEGLERVIGPLRNLCIVEIEAVAIANVVAKMEAGSMAPCPVWSDVKTFPAHLFRNRVDWLLGGYPCTPFSLAGKHLGADDPRHLWPHFERIIETVRPLRCLFENVDDHLTLGFPDVYCSLRRMGYRVEVGVYSAEEAGAPHERQRMFILAVENSGGDGNDWQNMAGKSSERNNHSPKRSGKLEYSDSKRFGKERECEIGTDKSNKLGNTNNARSQRRECGVGEERAAQWITGENGSWPSRPGESQQAWESPRAISREVESSMGLSVDGYNFREDFLRALGNMVVAQTAEIAIRDLLKKHNL